MSRRKLPSGNRSPDTAKSTTTTSMVTTTAKNLPTDEESYRKARWQGDESSAGVVHSMSGGWMCHVFPGPSLVDISLTPGVAVSAVDGRPLSWEGGTLWNGTSTSLAAWPV
jgi:hypothetical protein